MNPMLEKLAVVALAVLAGFLLVVAVSTWSIVGVNNEHITALVKRLDDLEHSKAKATARRFTADDAAALMRCLRIPNLTRSREECLQAVETQVEMRAKAK